MHITGLFSFYNSHFTTVFAGFIKTPVNLSSVKDEELPQEGGCVIYTF